MNTLHPKHLIALAAALLLGTSAIAQPAGAPPQGGPGLPPAGAAPAGPGGPPLPPGMPPMPPQEPVVYVTAAEIVDGKWQALDAASGASVRGAGQASGLHIVSPKDRVNGLIVRGQGSTTLNKARIEITGRGKSDFDGIAAGVLVKDQATLTLVDAKVVTRGVVASALTATDQSTLRVRRSHLVAEGGSLPSGYTRRIGPGMMEPPTPLGLSGTARTTLALGAAKVFYEDSTIEAEAWGALSTDAARGARLQADRCRIIVRRSGYGTYADNGASVVINDSTLDVPTFGGVIAGQASLVLNRVRSRSAGNTVMVHSVMGQPGEVAALRIQGGRLQSTNAAIVLKSANADIEVDGAQIEAGNGDLLLAVVNDDSHRTALNGTEPPGSRATLRHARLNGNVLNLDSERHLSLKLEDTQLRGRIHDAALSLDAVSRWTATADSRLLLQAPTTLAQIDAPRGVRIEAKAEPGLLPAGRHTLPGGGLLEVLP